jgi:hypothetical protein
MSPARRQALLAFAREHGAVIMEDDYDGEFRYEGSPLEALKAADKSDVVFYVGTFSKCLLPSLRLGFIVVPEWAMRTLIAAKNALDWHCATPLQMTVAAFIADGHLARHVRRIARSLPPSPRAAAQEFRGTAREMVRAHPFILRPMHATAIARPGVDVESAAAQVLRDGVRIHTLDRYRLGASSRSGLIFGYAAATPAQLTLGIKKLCRALSRSFDLAPGNSRLNSVQGVGDIVRLPWRRQIVQNDVNSPWLQRVIDRAVEHCHVDGVHEGVLRVVVVLGDPKQVELFRITRRIDRRGEIYADLRMTHG